MSSAVLYQISKPSTWSSTRPTSVMWSHSGSRIFLNKRGITVAKWVSIGTASSTAIQLYCRLHCGSKFLFIGKLLDDRTVAQLFLIEQVRVD